MASTKPEPSPASLTPNSEQTNRMLVRIADTYTRNMTGFLICTRGSSLAKESPIARMSIF